MKKADLWMRQIGVWLRAQRKAQGRTLREMGEDLGYGYSEISKWERGATPIPLLVFLELVRLFGGGAKWREMGEVLYPSQKSVTTQQISERVEVQE